MSLAKEQLQQDDTLLIESDLIFEDKVLDKILSDPFPNIALVAKYESWMDGTVVMLDNDNNILNFVVKKAFNFDHKEFYYKTVNIYKFSKEFSRTHYVPFLDAYINALGNNYFCGKGESVGLLSKKIWWLLEIPFFVGFLLFG